MQTQTQPQKEQKNKKRRSPWLIMLLIVVLLLFLISSIVLGAQLYKLATRDQYTVDMGLGEPDGSIELFRIEYENEAGEITVRGLNADKVVAPGTSVDYDLRLRNNDDVIVDFVMTPTVEFLTGDEVPVEFKIVDAYGNYVLGSETQWVSAEAMGSFVHKGSIHPGEVFTYHVSWQWAFEVSEAGNTYDTFLGSQTGDRVPGICVGITTESVANPTPVRDNRHMMHLLGDGIGCCWCCYLVWLLVLICLLLMIWVWRLRKKLRKLEESLEEYKDELRPKTPETL